MLIKVENRAFELPNAPSPKQWGGPFSFALLADPQLGLYCNNHSWEEEKQQLQECASAAAACSPKPSFILVLGDLLHAPVPALTTKEPAATEHRRLRDEQASDFVAAVDGPSQDVPLLVVPGNHDVGSTPTAESVAEYEQLWGKDYFSFWVGGVKFLCVNSCFFYDDALTAKEAEEQFDWLEKELADAAAEKAKHVFLLQHHQFYWRCWDEPDSEVHAVECRQQNKVNQSCIFRLPSKWKHRLLPLLEKHKVTATFHGHLHFESFLEDRRIPQIICASCGFATNDSRPGWRIVTVTEEGFSHEFIPVEWRTNNYPFNPPRCS